MDSDLPDPTPRKLYRLQWFAYATIMALFGGSMWLAGKNFDTWAFAALVSIALGLAYCASILCPRCTRPLMFSRWLTFPRKRCPHCDWPGD